MSNVIPLQREPKRSGSPSKVRPPKTADRAVYKVSEVAELLDLSLGSTYALLRNGEIPAKHLGGRWVISKQRFHSWLDDDQGQPSTQIEYVQEGRY